MNWYGDNKLQFNDEADCVGVYRVRVNRSRHNGVTVWNYYGVPPEVIVVLTSLYNEMKKPPAGGEPAGG